MERTIEITLISAEDLKRVNLLSKMEVYGVVWLSSDPSDRRRTAADEHNRRTPRWKGETFKFKIPECAKLDSILLSVQLRTGRLFGEDRDVGEVVVPALDFEAGVTRHVRYRVHCPKGRPKGTLDFSYRLSH